ncbi:MAG: type II toxin-antitoxin system VapC family toxin [Acidobacteria bacterium]|nr:type II toxin-antitoxin system VapC family toxin [Acidobacteriota bacterium]MCC6991829.1 type II toxin-antitoxin system VapC family toxin [Acidobacteriota bacterium]
MSSTLVDSNVLIDLFDEHSEWREWSDAMLTRAANRGPLIINPIVFAEVSAGFDSLDDVEAALPPSYVRREPLPWEAAFLAGRAFVQYRRRGGTRQAPLPDFYIGAHAAVAGHTLLTRDPLRYRHYFPRLRVVAP